MNYTNFDLKYGLLWNTLQSEDKPRQIWAFKLDYKDIKRSNIPEDHTSM